MRILLASILLCLLVAAPVAAQDGDDPLPNTFISADGSLTLEYPAEWFVDQGDGFVLLSNNETVLSEGVPAAGSPLLIIYMPNRYENLFSEVVSFDDAEALAEGLREVLVENENEVGDIEVVEVEPEDEDSTTDDVEENAGFALRVLELQNDIHGMFRVFTVNEDDLVLALMVTVEGEVDANVDLYNDILSTIAYVPPTALSYIAPSLGIQFAYPPEWYIDTSQRVVIGLGSSRAALEGDAVVPDEVSVVMVTSDSLRPQLQGTPYELGTAPDEIAENLAAFLFSQEGDTITTLEAEVFEQPNYPAWVVRHSDDEADSLVYTIDLGDTWGILVLFAATGPGQMPNFEPLVAEIARSVSSFRE